MLTRIELEAKLGAKLDPDAVLVICHPVTMKEDTLEEAGEFFATLETLDRQILFLYPNADAGSRRLIQMTKKFVASRKRTKLFVNFEHTYLSLLADVAVLLGNSSSGIIESTSVGLPTLNIGIRQRGREHAANVLDVPADKTKILKAIRKAELPGFRNASPWLPNPYGDGHACQKILKVLTETPLDSRLLFKA